MTYSRMPISSSASVMYTAATLFIFGSFEGFPRSGEELVGLATDTETAHADHEGEETRRNLGQQSQQLGDEKVRRDPAHHDITDDLPRSRFANEKRMYDPAGNPGYQIMNVDVENHQIKHSPHRRPSLAKCL